MICVGDTPWTRRTQRVKWLLSAKSFFGGIQQGRISRPNHFYCSLQPQMNDVAMRLTLIYR